MSFVNCPLDNNLKPFLAMSCFTFVAIFGT